MIWRAGSKPRISTSSGNPSSAARGTIPRSRRAATPAWRAIAQRRPRAAAPSGSSTFIETCAVPPRPCSSIADRPQPGQALAPALTDRRRDLAGVPVAGGASSTLNATSGGRAATRTAPARRMQPPRPEVGRDLAGGQPRREVAGSAAADLGPGATAGEGTVEEHGQPQFAAEPIPGDQRLGTAAPRSASLRCTSGTTSMAPNAGAAPAESRRSIRATASAAPATSAADSCRGSPASMNTARWWSGSLWRSSSRTPRSRSPRRSHRARLRSRPSDTFGTDSSVVTRETIRGARAAGGRRAARSAAPGR